MRRLKKLMHHKNWMAREDAATVLISAQYSLKSLDLSKYDGIIQGLSGLLSDREWVVSSEASHALGLAAKKSDISRYPGMMKKLERLLDDGALNNTRCGNRVGAAIVLGYASYKTDMRKYSGVVKKLGKMLKDKDPIARHDAAQALKYIAKNHPFLVKPYLEEIKRIKSPKHL
jgi:hypothetical protein